MILPLKKFDAASGLRRQGIAHVVALCPTSTRLTITVSSCRVPLATWKIHQTGCADYSVQSANVHHGFCAVLRIHTARTRAASTTTVISAIQQMEHPITAYGAFWGISFALLNCRAGCLRNFLWVDGWKN
jgi:hypothetical protein